MAETTEQRAYHLIEEVRADIDFELDDVIANIVRDLPEEYFERLKRADQLTHLKALLAMNICQLKDEIFIRSDDNRHVAVVGRRNFPGLLAKILERLPTDQPLIDAKIFTSKTSDFIIDLFEFETTDPVLDSDSIDSFAIENAIDEVARMSSIDRTRVREFASRYPKTSRVLTLPDELAGHFGAFHQLSESAFGLAVNACVSDEHSQVKLIVATNCFKAREIVQSSAIYLGKHAINIEQAFLNDLQWKDQPNTAICSFVMSGDSNVEVLNRANEIGDYLQKLNG